jgi:CheY-specific phosphatase CheX
MPADTAQLAGIAQEVLETMAFAFVMPGEPVEAAPEAIARATVRFTGPVNGTMTLAAPRSTMRELADNMLGEQDDSPDGDARRLDALGELANVICGNLLSAMTGPTAVFSLEHPEVQLIEEPPADAAPPADAVRLTVGDGWVQAALRIEADGQPASHQAEEAP